MKIKAAISAPYDEIIQLWESSVRATHDFITEKTIEEAYSIFY